MAEKPTGAVMGSGGLSEFSRMLSVFVNCSKLKVRQPLTDECEV